MAFFPQRVPGAPRQALGQAEHDAPAARADALVVAALLLGQLVAVAELPFDGDQVLDLQERAVGLATAAAQGLFAVLADLLVEADAELGGALEDVEQFAEGQPQ